MTKFAALLSAIAICSLAHADTKEFAFGYFTQPAPYSVSGLSTGNDGAFVYYYPTDPATLGTIVYKFTVPEQIISGTLYSAFDALASPSDSQYDPLASVYIDYSSDGQSWMNVNSDYANVADPNQRTLTRDLTVFTSNTVYIRAQLYASVNPPQTAQFLLSDDTNYGDRAIVLRLTSIPEPMSLTMALLTIPFLIYFRSLRN